VALRNSRLPLVVLAAAVLVGALAALGSRASADPAGPAALEAPLHFDAGPVLSLRPARLAATAPGWRGGPITTATGETVVVRVSDSLPPDNTPEHWAEFLTSLTHGPELSLLTMYVGTLDEVQAACGDRALGCYSGNQLMVPGETVFDGTTPEEIIRHEYGHHVAFNRRNPPWVAVDWGPKNWASSVDVCARAGRSEAFPGDEGSNYMLNPGEAWAETYRLMDEQKVGITTASWPIISQTFYPTEAALGAAERDVLQPWAGPRATVFKHVFPKKAKKPWWIRLQTPLDGDLKISATLPSAAEHSVVLLSGDRTKVLGRAEWVGQRVKRLTSTVCGQRSLFLRVTSSGTTGTVRVSVTQP